MKTLAYLAYPAQIVAVLAATLAWMVVVPILDLLTEEESETEGLDVSPLRPSPAEAQVVELVEERRAEAA